MYVFLTAHLKPSYPINLSCYSLSAPVLSPLTIITSPSLTCPFFLSLPHSAFTKTRNTLNVLIN